MRTEAKEPRTTSYVVLADPDRSAPRLHVDLATQEQLETEYAARLSGGRVFVPTETAPPVDGSVQVSIHVEPCAMTLVLGGRVTDRCAARGADPAGVVVDLDLAPERARELIDGLVPAARGKASIAQARRRVSPRVRAELLATITPERSRAQGRTGRTVNLSASGVLVAVDADGLALDQGVRLRLFCEETQDEVLLAGQVVRHVLEDERAVGVGIRFETPADPVGLATLSELIEREQERQAGIAISGPVQKLGIANLIQTFASTSGRGSICIANGAEEGWITFSHGDVLGAKLGRVVGRKALCRILCWTAGWFEFRVSDELEGTGSSPVPLDAMLLDVLRLLDELGRIDLLRFPARARVRAREPLHAEAQGDLPERSLDVAILSRSGQTVAEILDAIEVPDPEIYRELERLLDRDAIALES